ncbi:MAG: UvrD-helicase domain-containing protein [Verrucomicrobia bacterium]|nr:UvrD-helicase domain-containing protein [Verrucomicrobiota bacterium]
MHQGLNDQQREAVFTTEGRLLLLAGAGSGKTRVLTTRIAHLLQKGVLPEAILGLTFTNKAAREMVERVAKLAPPDLAKRVTLSTFHSFCLKVLRIDAERLGYTRDFTLYEEKDIKRLVEQIAKEEVGNGDLPPLDCIYDTRSRGDGADSIIDPVAHTVYTRLERAMRAHNGVDFNGLLTLTVQLFEEHPKILERYQERFRYLMIDEYQDTNAIQFRLAELLAQKYGNLCVVGDDDQSIYGWRGADIRNILNFSDAKVIKLEQNYRSSSTILKAANAVIAHNSHRHDKRMWSSKEAGRPITVFHAKDEKEEAEQIAWRCDQLREKEGLAWRDIAVLYRSNALSRQIEIAFSKYTWQRHGEFQRGIPFQVYGGMEFFDRREVKDLAAYLRVIQNPRDEAAILRTVNLPRRGVGEVTLEKLRLIAKEEGRPLYDVIRTEGRGNITKWFYAIEGARERFATEPLHKATEWLIREIEFEKAIVEDVKSDPLRLMKWDNIQELLGAMAEYDESAEEPSLPEFLSSITLDQGPKRERHGGNCVSLMTIHSAKGLEFHAVFLIGMEAHIMPHERSVKERGLEEERRLMYVACTRPKEILTISMARSRRRGAKEVPSQPSPFVYEIPKELRS